MVVITDEPEAMDKLQARHVAAGFAALVVHQIAQFVLLSAPARGSAQNAVSREQLDDEVAAEAASDEKAGGVQSLGRKLVR